MLQEQMSDASVAAPEYIPEAAARCRPANRHCCRHQAAVGSRGTPVRGQRSRPSGRRRETERRKDRPVPLSSGPEDRRATPFSTLLGNRTCRDVTRNNLSRHRQDTSGCQAARGPSRDTDLMTRSCASVVIRGHRRLCRGAPRRRSEATQDRIQLPRTVGERHEDANRSGAGSRSKDVSRSRRSAGMPPSDLPMPSAMSSISHPASSKSAKGVWMRTATLTKNNGCDDQRGNSHRL
jgi:hypothetical protein